MNGVVNTHNIRQYALTGTHQVAITTKLNAGWIVCEWLVLGAFFIDGNFNSIKYHDLMVEKCLPKFT